MLAKHDESVRLEEEDAVLLKAKSLTNGNQGCAKTMGDVIYWQTKEIIAQGKLLRQIALEFPRLQRKDDCALLHGHKVLTPITLFGVTYKVPLTVAIVVTGILIYLKGN